MNTNLRKLALPPLEPCLQLYQWKLKHNDLYQQGFVLVWDDTIATSVPWYTADWACVMNIPV